MKAISNIVAAAILAFALVAVADAGWVKQNSGTLAWLRDVHFFDANHGLAAGSGGAFLETFDGGKSWKKRASFTTDNIRQIFFPTESAGWLLCERDVYSRGGNSVSYLLKTKDGGANWEKSEFKDLGRARITKIFFNSKGNGYAIGESGSIFVEKENGEWEKEATSLRYLLLDGEFFAGSGALVGAGGSIYFTDDDGSTWNPANLFGDKTAKLSALYFLDKRNGWAVGAAGKIFQTFSAGRTWREQTSGVSVDLSDVAFRTTADGWAIGDQGLVLRTRTGGNVWFAEETPVKHRLEKLVLTSAGAIAVGFGGTVLVYDESAQPERNQSRPVMQTRNKSS